MKEIKIATRASKLALAQANQTMKSLSLLDPNYRVSLVEISTKGAQKEMLVPSLLAIAVPVVVGIVLGVAGVYVILILRDVRKIVRRTEQEAGLWQDELGVLRDALHARIERIGTVFDGLTTMMKTKQSSVKGRRRKNT